MAAGKLFPRRFLRVMIISTLLLACLSHNMNKLNKCSSTSMAHPADCYHYRVFGHHSCILKTFFDSSDFSVFIRPERSFQSLLIRMYRRTRTTFDYEHENLGFTLDKGDMNDQEKWYHIRFTVEDTKNPVGPRYRLRLNGHTRWDERPKVEEGWYAQGWVEWHKFDVILDGDADYSPTCNPKRYSQAPTPPPRSPTATIIGSISAVTGIIITAIIVVTVVKRRKKMQQKGTESNLQQDGSGEAGHHGVNHFQNPAFEDVAGTANSHGISAAAAQDNIKVYDEV